MTVSAGIDYSLSCPAVCVYNTDTGPFSFDNTSVFFRSNLARFKAFRYDNLEGCNHGPSKDDIDRYDDISSWAIEILKHFKVGQVYLEGYAFAATGRVFNIAENTAILKYNMWEEFIQYDVIPPKSVKKYATGSGNASKDKMYSAFCEEAPGIDLRSILTPRSSGVINPVSDIVDSYFILKYGLFN